ncbi:MAG: hypothetical protein ACLS4Z_05500 [Christensenellaceae bacterium]
MEDSSVEQKLKNYILILSVMKNHLNENLSLADLAQLCSMSVSLIEKSIFKHENCDDVLFNNPKMQSAAQKLNEGVSIKEAALSIGFPIKAILATVSKNGQEKVLPFIERN